MVKMMRNNPNSVSVDYLRSNSKNIQTAVNLRSYKFVLF